MRIYPIVIVLLAIVAASGAEARVGTRSGGGLADPKKDVKSPWDYAGEHEIPPDEISLNDGTKILGEIVEANDELIVIETEDLGTLEIDRARVRSISYGEDVYAEADDPDYNSIVLCPTPATLPAGSAYFRDFELILMNAGWSPTDYLDLSFGTNFPVTGSFDVVSIGGKLRLLDREKHGLGLALLGNTSELFDHRFSMLGGVLGAGDKHSSINLMIARGFDEDGDAENLYMLGSDYRIGRRAKVLVEFATSGSLFGGDEDFNGTVIFGVRFFSKRMSFTFAGVRPLESEDGDYDGLFALPLGSISIHW
jgi:hypothetical protein